MTVEAFIEDMVTLGFETSLDVDLIVYRVIPVDGALAGESVETGIAVNELKPWPQIPPHWLHFPDDIQFANTNSKTSSKLGWSKHSRQISGWGDAPAGIAWVSHIRAVLSEGTS